jgi:predicted nucleic acid-binding protein
MEVLTYLLDTNVIADRISGLNIVTQKLNTAIKAEHRVCLCVPVHYEVLRGLMWKNAAQKRQFYEQQFVPALEWIPLVDADWEQAARFWAETRRKGKQLSDADLLLAALATRLGAIIVSADEDFDALPVKRENWRN